MSNRTYRYALVAGALLAPIYFLYHPVLHERPLRPFTRRLWRCVGAGLLLYSLAAGLILWRKGLL